MASGSFQSGTSHNCYIYINWSSAAGTGGSSVYAVLYFKAIYRYNFTFRKGYSLSVNGESVTGNGVRVTSAGDWQLLSKSVWVGYTGGRTINISGNADCTTVTSNSSGRLPNYYVSGNAVLDNVGSVPSMPVVYTPSDSTVSETAKSITIGWSRSSSYSNWGIYRIDVSINGGSWAYVSGDLNFNTTSWTYNIPSNNSQGNTYRFRVSCGNDVGWSSHSYSGTVRINKVSAGNMSVPNIFNPYTATQNGDNSILPVTFTNGSQYISGDLYYKAQLYYGDKLVSPTTFSTSKNNLNLEIAIPSIDYVNTLGNTTYIGTFTIKAWVENQNGSKSNIIQSNFVVDINTDGGAEPLVDGMTLSGGAFNNPSTCFVVHKSKIGVKCGNVTLRRTPTLGNAVTTSYTIRNGNNEISNSNTGTIECWQSGTFSCSVEVRDSRGLYKTVEKQYVVQPYTEPRVEITSSGRDDKTPTEVVVNYKVYYSPIYQYTDVYTQGNQLNGIATQQYQKDGDDGTWFNYSTGKLIGGIDTNYNYIINIRVSDKFSTNSYSYDSCSIPTIKSLLSLRSYGVGLGCIPQAGNSLEVGGNAQFNDAIFFKSEDNNKAKELINFGWNGSKANHKLILEASGDLNLESYNGDSTSNLWINKTGEVTIGNTLNVKAIHSYENDVVNMNTNNINFVSNNNNNNGELRINGDDSVSKFVFNKPVEAPTINGYVFDIDTQNQVDTWVLVMKNEKIQHLWIGWSNWVSCGKNGCGITLRYRFNESMRLCELNWDGALNATVMNNSMGYMWNGFPVDKSPKKNVSIPVQTQSSDLTLRFYPVADDVTANHWTLTAMHGSVSTAYVCGTFIYSYA